MAVTGEHHSERKNLSRWLASLAGSVLLLLICIGCYWKIVLTGEVIAEFTCNRSLTVAALKRQQLTEPRATASGLALTPVGIFGAVVLSVRSRRRES
jgi:hypothetical protein